MTTSATFDPIAYKRTTKDQWETAAEAWHRWGPTLRTWLGPATERMLDLAGVASGCRVLDVAAGAGDQTLQAATRVGLIYFPDQQKALSQMRRVLVPGGRIAAIVYSTADRNGFFSVPVSIVRRHAKLGPPLAGQPGPFSLGGEGVLEQAFVRAGFRDVNVQSIAAPLRMASAAECLRFEQESFGALHQMLS